MLGLAIQKQQILCERNSVKKAVRGIENVPGLLHSDNKLFRCSDWFRLVEYAPATEQVCVYLPECPYWNLVYSFHFIVCFSSIEGLFIPFPCTSIFRIWHLSNQLVSNPDELELCSTLCWSIVDVKTVWLFGLYCEIYE